MCEDIHPIRFEATCSCGKKAIFIKTAQTDVISYPEGWKYSVSGWYCGKEGHDIKDLLFVRKI